MALYCGKDVLEVILIVLRKLSGQNICACNTDQVQAEFSELIN